MRTEIKTFPLITLAILLLSLQACSQEKDMPYNLTDEVEKQILDFKNQSKFDSVDDWGERGLLPSPDNIINAMEGTVNNTIDKIVESKEELTVSAIRGIFESELDNTIRLDTEEREFLAETLFELSEILKVDCKDELNSYLY